MTHDADVDLHEFHATIGDTACESVALLSSVAPARAPVQARRGATPTPACLTVRGARDVMRGAAPMTPTKTLLPLLAALLSVAACGKDDDASAGESSTAGTGTDATASTSTATSGSTGSEQPPTTGGGETASSDTTSAGTTGEPTTGGPPGDAVGCDGAPLLALPEDSSLAGPWPVGARTVAVGGLTAEVWYPAELGSDAGKDAVRYDIRTALPDAEQGKVPDDKNPWQDCDCYRDLPLDAAHGPYPAVVFVHGTAGFRSQSLELVTHWASRGFVVIAADHPGLWLKDLLGSLCGINAPAQQLGNDISSLVGALKVPVGDLGFLKDHVDGGRIGMAGHSAGGGAIKGFGNVAQVLIPMAAGGVEAGDTLESTLVLGAQADTVVAYSGQQSGYDSTPPRKRLVGIANAGHLAFSSLCSLKNAEGQDFLAIATEFDVCGAQFAGVLFDCKPTYTPDAINWQITNYASSTVLEETLHCADVGDKFAGLQDRFPDVGEFKEAL